MRVQIVILIVGLILAACSPSVTTSAPTNLPQSTVTAYVPSHPEISGDNVHPGQSPYSFLASSGEEVRYLLFVPDTYDPEEQWPLIVFLHGYSTNGSNINTLFNKTPTNHIDDLSDFSFIIVSPQLPDGLWPKMFDPINELVDNLTEILPIDPNEIFLTGLSSGGYGTWKYALRYPDRFTAIAPIASGPSTSASDLVPEDICSLMELPIWVFHGDADTWVSPEGNIETVAALEACGANVKFTLYPGANHQESWQNAYGDPALYEWFMEQVN